MTTIQQDLNNTIRDTAMLVSVHIKHWHASSRDHAAARAAAAESGAEGADAFKAVKNLMFRNDARLKAVLSAGGALRAVHNEMTMAWDAGKSPFRMLPTVAFGPYTSTIAKAKTTYDKALKDFTDHYLTDAAAARRALNIADDPNAFRLYPTETELASRFGVSLEFEPIPEGRQFRNIPEGAVEALSTKFENRVTRRYREALAQACTDLMEAMVHLREHLSVEVEDKSQKWRDSSVHNIVSGARTLIQFDLEQDPVLADWCTRVAQQFGRLNKKELTELRKVGNDDMRLECRELLSGFEIEFDNILSARED